ncbi:MAG TPA: hypothetical protein ENF25_00505 [Thermoprotei archaeon]|nr:hypothetical protein [Thermoprotei archaeon]
MKSVISIRVPQELKREMDRLRGEINWSEEIREFIRRKVQEYKKKKVLEEILSYIQGLPQVPRGTVRELVREDRDSH